MGNTLTIPHWNEERFEYVVECIKSLLEAYKDENLTLVSVGSGTGHYEKRIMEKCLLNRLLCVDSYADKHEEVEYVIKPEFKTVDDLLQDHANLIDNCILLLFWPYDQGHMQELNPGHPYDIEAISKLKPKGIVVLYEEYGAAGSNEFHAWLSKYTNLHSDLHGLEDRDFIDDIIPKDLTYKFYKKNKWRYGDSSFVHLNEKSIICGAFMRKDKFDALYPHLANEIPADLAPIPEESNITENSSDDEEENKENIENKESEEEKEWHTIEDPNGPKNEHLLSLTQEFKTSQE
jgi:hypothetical protein